MKRYSKPEIIFQDIWYLLVFVLSLAAIGELTQNLSETQKYSCYIVFIVYSLWFIFSVGDREVKS
jgi:hypothetical protein